MKNLSSVFACARLLVFVLAFGVISLALNNLADGNFWWDETAQFYTSMGLHHYSQPFRDPGDLADVIRFNRSQNLDPGGFSLIQHYWLQFSHEIAWIRLLPFCFFLLALGGIARLGYRLSGFKKIALLSSAVFMLYDDLLYFGLENRAYSMEHAGVVLGVAALVWVLEQPSYKRLFLLGMLLSFFMTSRYSYAITVCAVGATLMTHIVRSRSEYTIVQTCSRLSVFALPIFVTAAGILDLTLIDQLWPEMTHNTTIGLSAPKYTQHAVMLGNENFAHILFKNSLSISALPITISIVYLLLLQKPIYRFISRYTNNEIKVHRAINQVLTFVLLCQLLSLCASLIGAYPWDIEFRWSAYLLVVSAVSFVALISEFIHIQKHAFDQISNKPPGSTLFRPGGSALVGLCVIVAMLNAHSYRLSEHENRIDVGKQLALLEGKHDGLNRVFVTFYESPGVRFQYEYAGIRVTKGYPHHFRFETAREWRRKTRFTASFENLSYILSALDREELAKRFPSDNIHCMTPDCRYIFKIERYDANQ